MNIFHYIYYNFIYWYFIIIFYVFGIYFNYILKNSNSYFYIVFRNFVTLRGILAVPQHVPDSEIAVCLGYTDYDNRKVHAVAYCREEKKQQQIIFFYFSFTLFVKWIPQFEMNTKFD